MNRTVKKKSESALDDLVRAFEAARDEIMARVAKLDTGELRGQALKMSKQARRRAEQRIRPRRRSPNLPLLALALGLGAGIGYLLVDANRRNQVRSGVARFGETARDRMDGMGVSSAVDGVMSKVRPNNSAALQDGALKSEVEAALGSSGLPAGVDLSVEGRTVYLRGTVSDTPGLDRSMERIQALPGVVAVVNLTVPAAAGSANSH